LRVIVLSRKGSWSIGVGTMYSCLSAE
jgi:hypothetical protein